MTAKNIINDVEIYRANRLRASREGNPRYELETNRGTYRTETNGQINYAITNYLGDSRVQPVVDLYLTNRGMVYAVDAPVTGDRPDMLRAYWKEQDQQ